MKSSLYSFLCLIGLLLALKSYATETEPNNTKAQANTLALNGSNTGAINPAGDLDWWKVTTNKDGKLNITITTVVHNLQITLFDNNGTTSFGTTNTYSTTTLSVDGLAAGTYYIQLNCYFGADTITNYTVSNTLTLPAVLNDAEPNNTSAQALTLPLNGSADGHVGYYYNQKRDTSDWYKVTTNADGLLKLTITTYNGQNVECFLYDNNATLQLNVSNTYSTVSFSTDGLAAGTYYLKVTNYYSGQFSPYTISDSLKLPAIANDVEPNNTSAQALTLALNGSASGHLGYYFNQKRDTSDWYKVTTNADGLLKLTITTSNGQNVECFLYDNNTTTQLNVSNTYNTVSFSTDGLAAGTYYLKVTNYYSGQFSPYTISDSLKLPAVANDAEPNNTSSTAKTFSINSTINGHTGYYYNLKRDTFDWYKLITTLDGYLQFTFTTLNGQNVRCVLYDNNGTTEIAENNTYNTGTLNIDALGAGTYYLRVSTYFGGQFSPYTVTNVLSTYSFANDQEPNDVAKKAKTMPANGTSTGHLGFYQNGGIRNDYDWWKINYTGSGALTINFNQNAFLSSGGDDNLAYEIYQDTAASAILTGNSYSLSFSATLSSLAQGYYWVKVYPYFLSTQFSSYSINPVFTQVNKAKIVLQSATVGTTCTDGSLRYKCSNSHSPYKVQLYRYGLAYGNALSINSTSAFNINSLPPGSYFATAYGDGATGTARGTSATSVIVPVPTNTTVLNIKPSKATLKWDSLTCIKYDSVYYRALGSATWTKVKTTTHVGFYILTGLTPSTSYEWEVAHVDTGNGQTVVSSYTAADTFTTAGMKMEGDNSSNDQESLTVYPNPVSDNLTISFNSSTEGKVLILVYDVNGKTMLSQETQAINGLNQKELDLSKFASGLYSLQLITADGKVYVQQVVKAKE